MKDPDQEDFVKEITELLKTPRYEASSNEEKAKLLWQDLVGPYVQAVKDHCLRLAYAKSVGRSRSN